MAFHNFDWRFNNDRFDYTEHYIVEFCRKGFKDLKEKHKINNSYNTYWIDVKGYDDRYEFASTFYPEVLVYLYPKTVDFIAELKRMGITAPKKPKAPPKGTPKNSDKHREYAVAMNYYRQEWENYKSIVYDIIHKDLTKAYNNKVEPIKMKMYGVRFPKVDGYFVEQYKGIEIIE